MNIGFIRKLNFLKYVSNPSILYEKLVKENELLKAKFADLNFTLTKLQKKKPRLTFR